jgi:hypothetical protein
VEVVEAVAEPVQLELLLELEVKAVPEPEFICDQFKLLLEMFYQSQSALVELVEAVWIIQGQMVQIPSWPMVRRHTHLSMALAESAERELALRSVD